MPHKLVDLTAVEAKLDALLTEFTGDIETLLNSIVTNTGNIKIDADSVNLNTDTLEAKLEAVRVLLAGVLQTLALTVPIDTIARDGAGRIQSWRENGTTTHTVTRDGAGRVTAVS